MRLPEVMWNGGWVEPDVLYCRITLMIEACSRGTIITYLSSIDQDASHTVHYLQYSPLQYNTLQNNTSILIAR